MSGVLLAVLIVLNLRNGFGLANVGGNTQTGVIGAILIGSVLAQNAHRPAQPTGTRRTGPTPTGAGMPMPAPVGRSVGACSSMTRPAHNHNQGEEP